MVRIHLHLPFSFFYIFFFNTNHPASKSEPMITDLEICYGRFLRKRLQLGSHDLSCINFAAMRAVRLHKTQFGVASEKPLGKDLVQIGAEINLKKQCFSNYFELIEADAQLGTHQTTDRPDLQKTYSAPKRTCFESLYTETTRGRFFISDNGRGLNLARSETITNGCVRLIICGLNMPIKPPRCLVIFCFLI